MSKNVEKQKLNEERILSTRPLLADVANCRRRHGYNEKMTAGLRPLQPPPPEWLHTGPYFLLALALHLAVVFYPLPLSVDKLEVTPPLPVTVTLQEELAPPQVIPPAPPEKVQKPIKQHREKPPPAPRPVVAVTPAKVSAPTTFTVPAPVVTPPPPCATGPRKQFSPAGPSIYYRQRCPLRRGLPAKPPPRLPGALAPSGRGGQGAAQGSRHGRRSGCCGRHRKNQ